MDLKNQKKVFAGLQSNTAFTLVEIMVVIGILSILSAVALPGMFNPEYKLKKAARELMGDMQKTRSMAIKTNTQWGIWFDTANDRYLIFSSPGTDGAWSGIDTDGSQPTEKEVTFSGYAAGVQYGHGAATKTVTGSTSFPINGTTFSGEVLTFNPKGLCSPALTGYGNRYVYIAYNDMTYALGTGSTGVVRIYRWNGSDWK